MRVLAATDKFRGTASAAEVASAVARAVASLGGQCDEAPVADGGEGTLAALGGPTRSTIVMGPLGDPVEASWRLQGGTAVIEMALASGMALLGGADDNDPIAASTHGTGELIAAALDAGAKRIIVGMGGSATTDGGLGAVRAIWGASRLRRVELIAACDVRTTFVDAARVFAPQKGATPAQVALLARRLERLVDVYREDFGVDVATLAGGGAAGGLGGGLAALGAELVSGFELIADEVRLAERIGAADVVVTGEGFLDEESFEGKVVGGVLAMAARAGTPVLAVVGEVLAGVELPPGLRVASLVECCGRTAAFDDTAVAIEDVVRAPDRARAVTERRAGAPVRSLPGGSDVSVVSVPPTEPAGTGGVTTTPPALSAPRSTRTFASAILAGSASGSAGGNRPLGVSPMEVAISPACASNPAR